MLGLMCNCLPLSSLVTFWQVSLDSKGPFQRERGKPGSTRYDSDSRDVSMFAEENTPTCHEVHNRLLLWGQFSEPCSFSRL